MLVWMKELKSEKARNARIRAGLAWGTEFSEEPYVGGQRRGDLVRMFEISPGVHG